MSKTYRDQSKTSKHPNRSAIASNVARGMVMSGTGKGGPMSDGRERRANNPKRRLWDSDDN